MVPLPIAGASLQPTAGAVKPVGIDEDVIQEFLPTFIGHRAEQVCRLQVLLEDCDHKGLAEVLHPIKGTSGLYGFMQITEAALAGNGRGSLLI